MEESNIKKVAVVFGGRSAEHEVSIRSAKNIIEALDKNLFQPFLFGISQTGTWFYFSSLEELNKKVVIKDEEAKNKYPTVQFSCEDQRPTFHTYLNNFKVESISIDVAFPILHGSYGEDGCVQGLFQMLNLPFVGCSVLSSAIGMDKEIMKKIFLSSNILTSPWKTLYSWDMSNIKFEELAESLGVPFFIKPANAGSSVGVHKIKSKEDFVNQLKDSFLYDSKVIAERFVKGREIECSVKGLQENPQASLPGEVISNHEFYSYEAKYLDENGAIIKIPADLKKEEIIRIQVLAQKVYQVLCCSGLSRVDFFLTEDSELFVNEINTMPGFTNISMYPKMWEAIGIKYSQLITDLIQTAERQFHKDTKLKRTF